MSYMNYSLSQLISTIECWGSRPAEQLVQRAVELIKLDADFLHKGRTFVWSKKLSQNYATRLHYMSKAAQLSTAHLSLVPQENRNWR